MGVPRINVSDLATGVNFKAKLTSGPSMLIRYIWIKNGGLEEAARRLKFFSQQLNAWQSKGKVPLKHVGKIARQFGVPMLALNYDGVIDLLGSGLPWKSVVKMVVLENSNAKSILDGTPPKYSKGKKVV